MSMKDKFTDFKNKKINCIYQCFVVVVDDVPLTEVTHSIERAYEIAKPYINVNDVRIMGQLARVAPVKEDTKNETE